MGSVGYYMNNLVNVEKAGINDNDALVKMRLEYLIEDNGNITGRGKEINSKYHLMKWKLMGKK